MVDSPAPISTVVDCVACHNSVTAAKDSVVMPSGIELTGLGSATHGMPPGAQSKVSVDAAIANTAVDDGAVSAILASAISTTTRGGYQVPRWRRAV